MVYALIFHDFTRALYGLVGLYVSSIAMDRVVYGANASKVAYIISDHHEAITAELLRLERGVTLMEGKGAYSGTEKQVILCVVNKHQLADFKKILSKYDDTFSFSEMVNETYGNFKHIR